MLPYLDIPSNNTEVTNQDELITVPNVENKTYAEAKKVIENAGLTFKCEGQADDIIKEQMPKSGTQLISGGIVKTYVEGNDARVSQTVPDLKGVTLSQAKIMLKAKNLNISSTGDGIVIAQDPKAGKEADEGTVINVTLQQETTKSQN